MGSAPLPAVLEGLSSAEARRRLLAHGENRLAQPSRWARVVELVSPLFDPMALMLLGAAALYLLLGEVRDGIVMMVALVPVLGVDVFLQARSRSALKKLAQTVAPRARVVRDGREVVVDTTTLVPGDVLVLGEGDVLHADGVVLKAANLATDESSLTGESEPQAKRPANQTAAGTAEDAALFYAGSVVLSGHGHGEIRATGQGTRFGEIARLVAAAASAPSPLQQRVAWFVRRLALVVVGVAGAVFALGAWRGQPWAQAMLGAVSLAMAAIPEEFPLVFTLFLSLGAFRLSRRGVLVRRLASVETLGSTTVICTDKTGTLTKGQFVVEVVVPLAAAMTPADVLRAAVLACELPAADPMERAIEAHAEAAGVAVADLSARWRLLRDHDFDAIGKHMSHVWQQTHGAAEAWIVAKGAFEGVAEHCALAPAALAEAETAVARLAQKGTRVLAVAGRRGASTPSASRADDERDLELYGLIGFSDPVRAEVPAAVGECQAAGVQVKVVTGDHALTAHAVAHAVGLAHADDGIVTGPELVLLDPAAQRQRIRAAAILARITPAQKHLIIETLRAQGEVVAMTGDGINDAPALRRSDIGVAMGLRGTEVARAAADLVLLDDNFASIVAAIREGRGIFRDIQRAFLYLMSFHVPIVGLALLAPMIGVPLLLMPVHLVWLELVVHPVSALLFQGDSRDQRLMRTPPRDPRAPMLPRAAVARSLLSGVLLTAVVFAVYLLMLARGETAARGLALLTLLLGYQLLALVERVALDPDQRDLLPRSVTFWGTWLLAGVSLPVLMYLPATAALLRVAPAGGIDWLLALAGAGVALGWRLLRRAG